ncbi:slr1659 superfamily regulator [Nodosilinea sp. AN01ver1]|uniref:slr1659 superfamily regulator n=1 Tax=Nodosilinea sp. AN01ver1 TaxID=3423362 RepID=UPI003D31C68E
MRSLISIPAVTPDSAMIETDDYRVYYPADTATVVMEGFLRLNGIEAYQPVMDLLMTAAAHDPCTVDLHQLEFLNSSGISMLSMFVVKVRDRGTTRLSFRGSEAILWQTRSRKNLKRLMPDLPIEMLRPQGNGE